MNGIQTITDAIPDVARDLRLNLDSVLGESILSDEQKWGCALACAYAARNDRLRDGLASATRTVVGEAVVDDARAAAALMAMNNVFYRFRHLIGKEVYGTKPARLRMARIGKPTTSKADFELFCLAVSAINACEVCVQAHEKVILEAGISEDHVHEAIRIAAVIHGVAVALELG